MQLLLLYFALKAKSVVSSWLSQAVGQHDCLVSFGKILFSLRLVRTNSPSGKRALSILHNYVLQITINPLIKKTRGSISLNKIAFSSDEADED